MNEIEKIELRSKKVRDIIGKIPPTIVRFGMIAMLIIITGLLMFSYFIPYPETIKSEAIVLSSHKIELSIPYKYINTIKVGMKTKIEFEGFDIRIYDYINGTISDIDRSIKLNNKRNKFIAIVLPSSGKYDIEQGMIGSANILISQGSILERILQRATHLE